MALKLLGLYEFGIVMICNGKAILKIWNVTLTLRVPSKIFLNYRIGNIKTGSSKFFYTLKYDLSINPIYPCFKIFIS